MFAQVVLRHARHQLARTVTQTFVQVHLHITGQSRIAARVVQLLVRQHELLVETVAQSSLVVRLHQVLDSHRLRTVRLANPVGIRQVDADRSGRIAVARQDGCRDNFGRNALTLSLFILGVSGRVVLKPLRVLRHLDGTLRGCQVLVVDQRFPRAGDTQRVAVHLCETVHKIHAALQVFHPRNSVFVEGPEVAGLVERNQFLQHHFLLLGLGVG